MREISTKEYKQILLGAMDYVHQFCEEKRIPYYLIGGSLLGAVRHKGFIPWDDDIDICMMREDYERFCAEFRKHDTAPLEIVSIKESSAYYLPFAKVIDTRTCLVEHIAHPMKIGVYLDIFPVDACPGLSLNEAIDCFNSINWRRSMLYIKHIQLFKRRAIYKYPLIVFAKAVVALRSRKRIVMDVEREASKYCKEMPSAKHVAQMVLDVYGERQIWEKAWFGNGVCLPFEGRTYWAPTDSDAILTRLFGEYMTLPPENKRIPHHIYDVWYRDGNFMKEKEGTK